MIKRAAILAALASLFIATAGYAPCFYPKSRHVDYYQRHTDCVWDPYVQHWACTDDWSLDGTCDTDCDGNTACEGDTHVDSQTILEVTLGSCAPVCD